jgi:Ca-activated chloride channel family protein
MMFAQPAWLYSLLFIPLLGAIAFYSGRRSRKRLERLVASRLLPDLTDAAPPARKMIKRILFLGAIFMLIVALARPQMGFTEQEFVRHGRDVMLAIDTSKSMLSTDIPPNRLTRAKLAAQDVVNSMIGDRFGIIAFAGASQVEAPLTIDYQDVIDSINQLDTKTVERGGTDISSSIYSAELALGRSEQSSRSLVLFTDGEDLDEDSVKAAREAAASGIRIFTVGIGTKEGSAIPTGTDNRQYLRDRDGNVVHSRLDEDRLRRIARETGGFYVHLDNEGVARLVSDGLRKRETGNSGSGSSRIPVERYRWPLSLSLLLLLGSSLLSSRRRNLTGRLFVKTAVAAALLAPNFRTEAASSLERYNQGDFEGALEAFRDELKSDPDSAMLNFNAGDAAYRLQKFDEAFEAYSKAMVTDDLPLRQKAYYNAGNALFMLGNQAQETERQLSVYYDARYQYQQAIDLNPADEQAKKNLRLLEERIKEAEKQKTETRQKRQNRRSRGQRKQSDRNSTHKDQNSVGPDQQDDANKSEGDEEKPGDQSQELDPEQGPDEDNPTKEPSPGKQKDGQVQELAPSDQPPKDTPGPGNEKPGQMSEEEALGLLHSLKDEGDKIDLMRRKTERGVSRDW